MRLAFLLYMLVNKEHQINLSKFDTPSYKSISKPVMSLKSIHLLTDEYHS